MKVLDYDAPWEEIMEYVELIEGLKDPYGMKGFYVVRIGRWLGHNSCHIEFHREFAEQSWRTDKIADSYAPVSKKKVMVSAINDFIRWYNEVTKKQTN